MRASIKKMKDGMLLWFWFALVVTAFWGGYAAYGALATGLSSSDRVNAGSGLTATSWNKLVNSAIELDARTRGTNVSVFQVNEPDGALRTYSWQTIFNNAKNSGKLDAGGIYDCVIATNNGSHFGGRRFTVGVNGYDNYHRITNMVDVDSGFMSGCSTTLSAVDGNGFSYQYGNCNQVATLTCTKLN